MASPLGSRYLDMTGQKFGRLTFVRFAGLAPDRRALWVLKCECGNELVAIGKNVRSGRTRSCGCLVSEVARRNARTRRIPAPGYAAIHDRLKVDRGPASSHPCVDCTEPARDWSLRRDALNVMSASDNYHGNPRHWSVNLDDYEPRCKPCHGAYDSRGVES